MKSPKTSISTLLFGTLMLQLACTLPATAYYEDYLPGHLIGKLSMTPQRTIEESFGGKWQREVMPGVTASVIEGQFVLKGKDRTGVAWTLEDGEDRGLGGSCFAADVDGNGEEDLIFWFATGSCGLPFSVVDIYFFDKAGRAHREEAVSRFTLSDSKQPGKGGVLDLVLSEDGKSSLLLIQDLTYGKVKGIDHSYWRWSILKAEDCKLKEVKSAFGRSFPCSVWFTKRPNHKTSRSTGL